jgi:hypothetical protein
MSSNPAVSVGPPIPGDKVDLKVQDTPAPDPARLHSLVNLALRLAQQDWQERLAAAGGTIDLDYPL